MLILYREASQALGEDYLGSKFISFLFEWRNLIKFPKFSVPQFLIHKIEKIKVALS